MRRVRPRRRLWRQWPQVNVQVRQVSHHGTLEGQHAALLGMLARMAAGLLTAGPAAGVFARPPHVGALSSAVFAVNDVLGVLLRIIDLFCGHAGRGICLRRAPGAGGWLATFSRPAPAGVDVVQLHAGSSLKAAVGSGEAVGRWNERRACCGSPSSRALLPAAMSASVPWFARVVLAFVLEVGLQVNSRGRAPNLSCCNWSEPVQFFTRHLSPSELAG